MKLDEMQLDFIRKNLRTERWDAMFKAVVDRRDHFANARAADPKLGEWKEDKPVEGNPFKDLTAYQSDELRKNATEVIPRVIENHYEIRISPPKESEPLTKMADNLQSIFNSWAIDVEDRRGGTIQEAMAWPQYRDCYAVLHVRRNDDVYPKLDYEWKDELKKGDEKRFRAYEPGEGKAREEDCPECEGSGKVEREISDTSVMEIMDGGLDGPCERCGGTGTIAVGSDARGKYRERGEAFLERDAKMRAKAGCQWTLLVRETLSIVPVFDEDPRGGMGMCLFEQEVGLLDYLMAGGINEAGATLEEIQKQTGLGLEQAAPGFTLGTLGVNADTPSSSQWGKRVRVYQLWTREEVYEGCDFGGDTFRINKKASGAHGLGEVPFWIVPAFDTGEPDPVRRWLPYGEGLYRLKEFRDRIVTLFGGMSELTALQQYYTKRTDPKAPRVLEDGSSVDEQRGGGLGGELPEGHEVVMLPMNVSPALQGFMEKLDEEFKASAPQSGNAEIGATTAPWTARIWQTQANVGPKMMVQQQQGGLKRAWDLVKRWHGAHPEEPLAAYPREEDNRVNRGNLITVDLEEIDLDEFDLSIVINPTTQAEQITQSEQASGYYERGLLQEVDFYEQMGKKNPSDYIIGLHAEQDAAPFKAAWRRTKIASVMGGEFMAGVNGQTLDANGQPVAPEQAMAANGWQPQQQGPPQDAAQAMGGLPPVEAPGTVPVGGLV